MIKIFNNPQLTNNFKLSEMTCKCGCGGSILHPEGIALLQKIRDHFKKPITICSNYRCPKHNKAIGGDQHSFHLTGEAWDIKVSGVDPLTVGKYALAIGFKGVGVYTHNGDCFTHVDIGNRKSLWMDSNVKGKLVKVNKF